MVNMAWITDHENNKERWYFDSGCSKHMTGNRTLLTNVCDSIRGSVTYGDGQPECIVGRGSTFDSDSPQLAEVHLVEGLTMNLISVSQLCSNGLNVAFDMVGCRVANTEGNIVMSGSKVKNDCYVWDCAKECQFDDMNKSDKGTQGADSSGKTCIKQVCRTNTIDKDSEWFMDTHIEIKALTQNHVWNLITCSSDHCSTGSKLNIIKCLFDGIVVSDARPERKTNNSRLNCRSNRLLSHNLLRVQKGKEWVIRLLYYL